MLQAGAYLVIPAGTEAAKPENTPRTKMGRTGEAFQYHDRSPPSPHQHYGSADLAESNVSGSSAQDLIGVQIVASAASARLRHDTAGK